MAQLRAFGGRVLPAYEAILADPKSEPLELAVVLGLVSEIKADRQRFPDRAAALLNHEAPIVRCEALKLLGDIGTARDTPPVISLLSDDDPGVRHAAKTLVRVGGARDLLAVDIWLKTGNQRDDAAHLRHVKACRDALAKRLQEESKAPKK